MADVSPDACSLCCKPAGDMAATVAYAGIPVVTLCDACAQAAVGAWEVGRVVAGQIREKIQAGKAKEGGP